MGHQIVRQPNERFAIWSTVVDNFIAYDCTPEDWIQMRIKEEEKLIRKNVMEIVKNLESGQNGYKSRTLPIDNLFDGLKRVKRIHGQKEYEKLCKELKIK